ncbi:DNA adenine methylase [Hugenholtzia roseola]|uniref:DNA adenine methylase n=1 Tax=Hugenholtzia roseola TaxID=1002 RepID=UPI0006880D8C|nr:DNA adenine methylase [Hugenholtzia roseola]
MQSIAEKLTSKQIKSPLNYIGGKYKLLKQILPLFPKEINTFVDLFAGGCNVGLNVKAEKRICNDNLKFLVEMYQDFQKHNLSEILQHIENQINKFELSLTNEEGYKKLREHYNQHKNPLDLFVLVAFSFNHQIRFNNSHEFNNPFGRERSSFNDTMRTNLMQFVRKIQAINVQFTCFDFAQFDFSHLTENDFVYCDPPYLISLGTYNDGKRGFTGWNESQEYKLLAILENLHQRNIKFALSNVLEHKGKENEILKNWLTKNNYLKINYLRADYSNSNYQTLVREKNASIEVLITNYESSTPKNLFG